jgi:hypothetical protein
MLTRRMFVLSVTALPVAAALSLPAFAASPEVFSAGGVAINGYDPVAYFTQMKPVKGTPANMLDWNGASWQFASASNRAAFEANPRAYAPQYGGYCAYAVAQGYTAKTDPDAWTIVQGKLYLNFSKSVRRRWERDIPGQVAAADMNWPGVLAK